MECSVKPGGSTRQFWAIWMVSGIGPNNKWQRGCWKFPWVLASNAHWQIYYTMAWYFIIIALERRHHPHVTTTGNSCQKCSYPIFHQDIPKDGVQVEMCWDRTHTHMMNFFFVQHGNHPTSKLKVGAQFVHCPTLFYETYNSNILIMLSNRYMPGSDTNPL